MLAVQMGPCIGAFSLWMARQLENLHIPLLAALHPTGSRFDTEHPYQPNISLDKCGNNRIKKARKQ
jgi:hypothetical protein